MTYLRLAGCSNHAAQTNTNATTARTHPTTGSALTRSTHRLGRGSHHVAVGGQPAAVDAAGAHHDGRARAGRADTGVGRGHSHAHGLGHAHWHRHGRHGQLAPKGSAPALWEGAAGADGANADGDARLGVAQAPAVLRALTAASSAQTRRAAGCQGFLAGVHRPHTSGRGRTAPGTSKCGFKTQAALCSIQCPTHLPWPFDCLLPTTPSCLQCHPACKRCDTDALMMHTHPPCVHP